MSKVTALTSKDIQEATIETLSEVIELKGEGEIYTKEDILNVLVAAAAERTTIEQACEDLDNICHSNTARNQLKGLKVEEVEAQINKGLISAISLNLHKRSWKIAIDLTLHPYYGKVTEQLQEYVIRSAAKNGTTRFFGYATVYGIKKNHRYTLGLHILRKDESLLDILILLLGRVKELGIPIKRLYLDRGFYSIEICRYLQKRGIPTLMPVVKKGKKGGIRQLFTGQKSYQTTYTLRNQKTKESVTIQVAIICIYQKGKRGKNGRRYFGYTFFNYKPSLKDLYEDYRLRFGIETGYRVGNQARCWTTSRKPALRLLLFGIALLLENIWIHLKWCRISQPRRGGRLVWERRFPFRRMLYLLLQAIRKMYGVKDYVLIPHAHLENYPKRFINALSFGNFTPFILQLVTDKTIGTKMILAGI